MSLVRSTDASVNARAVTLYRGLAVPKADAKATGKRILSEGMLGREGRWQIILPDISHVRASLEALFCKPDLTRNDVLVNSQFRALCASGTAAGAAYYAIRHNHTEREDHPLVVEFTVSIDDICVDPRDFLCSAFQFWDRQSNGHRAWQSEILCQLFGPRILRYFEACQSTDQVLRIAMCNLAACDPEVVLGHLRNRRVIVGRYRTEFASAFLVKPPVSSDQISRIYEPVYRGQALYVSLDEFLKGEVLAG